MAEALAIAALEACDAVIIDVGLPDGTGHELMASIRQRHNWPGIAISGYGAEEDRRRSLRAGFVVHLIKPVDRTQLRHALATIAGSRC